MRPIITLEEVRKEMAPLNDGIVWTLFNRARLKRNKGAYENSPKVLIEGFYDSFFHFLLHGTENVHNSAQRYLFPEEHHFSNPNSKIKVFRSITPGVNLDKSINMNPEILESYFRALDSICPKGDDINQYGLSVEADLMFLPLFSRRVNHFGKKVAEAKYQEHPFEYQALIDAKDKEGLLKMLTDSSVENRVLASVSEIGQRYGMNPELISEFYKNEVMRLTKKAQVRYLSNRKIE